MAEGFEPKYMEGAESDLQVTPKTNVTIRVSGMHKIGNWIYGFVQFNVTSAMTYFDYLLDLGVTSKYKWHGCLLTEAGNVIANKGVYIDPNTTILRTGNSIDAGTYTVQLMIYVN